MSLPWLSPQALAEIDAHVRAIVTEIAARPSHVSQKTVNAVCSVPPRDYLAAARAGAFTSSKVGRLVLASTSDVIAWINGHRRAVVAANDDPSDDFDLAAVGGRRVT